MQAFGLVPADFVKVHPVEPGLGRLQAQLVLARLGLREIEAAGLKDAAALTGLLLERVVEGHGVMLDAADVGAVMQPVNVRGGMPGRATGQLVPLHQNNVCPAQFGQMVQDGATDNAASDDDGLGMGAHYMCPR